MRTAMRCATMLLAVLSLCGTAIAEKLACYDTYQVKDVLEYPFDFGTKPKGTLADCIEWAKMDIADGAVFPSSPAYDQWSAKGFDNGGSFVFTVQAKDVCPTDPTKNACFDPELLYAGGIKRSGTGPTSCTVTVSWIDCGDTEVQSAVIDSYTVTESYRNDLYDLDVEIPSLGCDELGCVEWLQVKWHATGASSSSGTFRVGDYYDGAAYYDFGVTGECCCASIPEPATLAMLLTGCLGVIGLGRRQK